MSDHSGFVASLRAERETFHALCEILQSEQACLVNSDVDGLLQLVPVKSEKVDALVALAQRRVDHLEAVGLSSGQDGMADWLATQSSGQRAELTQVWQDLVRFAADARSLNDINGKLITSRLSHNQEALAALHLSARAQNIYGPDGQASVVPAHRQLGRA